MTSGRNPVWYTLHALLVTMKYGLLGTLDEGQEESDAHPKNKPCAYNKVNAYLERIPKDLAS